MGGWWLFIGMVCGCGTHPAWPKEGEVNAAWVTEALEWRAHANVRNCPDIADAVDALTLEWIADSQSLTVRIEQQDWPVLLDRSEWVKPLVQILALESLHGDSSSPVRITRKLQRRILLSHPMYREDRKDIRRALQATRQKRKQAA